MQVREADKLWPLRVEFLENIPRSWQPNRFSSSRLIFSFHTKIMKIMRPCRVFVKSVRYQTYIGALLSNSHDTISIDQFMPITINSFKYRLNLRMNVFVSIFFVLMTIYYYKLNIIICLEYIKYIFLITKNRIKLEDSAMTKNIRNN